MSAKYKGPSTHREPGAALRKPGPVTDLLWLPQLQGGRERLIMQELPVSCPLIPQCWVTARAATRRLYTGVSGPNPGQH